jgi:hypothetical protein
MSCCDAATLNVAIHNAVDAGSGLPFGNAPALIRGGRLLGGADRRANDLSRLHFDFDNDSARRARAVAGPRRAAAALPRALSRALLPARAMA